MRRLLFFILCLTLLLTSCEDSSGRGNLRIILETSGTTKTIRPDESSSTVVKYNVQGTGPGGKTFSKDSSSKSITLEGITMGTWTVTATGYNANSVAVISGTKTFTFDNSTKAVYVNMSSFSGAGSLSINILWDSEISNPIVETELVSNSESITATISTTDNSNSCKYSHNSLQAGTYLLNVKLYNGESFITGCVESILIVNNKTTTGDVSLKSPEGSNQDVSYDTEISGHFTYNSSAVLPLNVEANQSMQIGFVLDEGKYSSTEISWFLDGTLIKENVFSVSLEPKVGDHIINVVLSETSGQKSGSASYSFTAKTSAKKGSATFVSSLKNTTSKLILASDSLIGALPGEYYVVVTPSRSSMQVFSIFKNSVQVLNNKTYNATDLNFLWLPQVSALYSNPGMNFFVLQTGDNTVHVLFFNQKSGIVELATWNEEPVFFTDFVKSPPAFIDKVTTVALVPSTDYAGSIFIFDSGSRSEEIIGVNTTSSEIKGMATSIKDESMKSFVCSDGFGEFIATVTGTNELKYAKFKNAAKTTSWYSFSDNSIAPIKNFRFLNSRYAVFETGTYLRIYEFYYQQKVWVSRTTINTSSNCMGLSNNGAFIYVSDDSKNLISYRSGLTDNFGKIYTEELDNSLQKFVVNNLSIIGVDNEGNLYIFDINQEDTTL